MTDNLNYKKLYFEAQQKEIELLFCAEQADPGSILELVSCPLCGCSDSSPKYIKNKFSIVRCLDCSFIYTNPRVAENVYRSRLTQSESSELWALHQESDGVKAFNKLQYEFFFEGIACDSAGQRYLDIGASTGVCLDIAREKGFQTFAIEWSDTARKMLRSRNHAIISGLESSVEAPFDWISFYEVLEHQHDPKKFLRQVKSKLNPGGIVSLSVPNINSMACLIMGSGANSIDGFQHLSYFSKTSLVSMFSEIGFDLIYMDTSISAIDQLEAFFFEQGTEVSKSCLNWIARGSDGQPKDVGLGYRIRAIFKNRNE